MKRLTEEAKLQAIEILERYSKELHDSRQFNSTSLELELRKKWNIGYQTLKHVMIDMLTNHREFEHLAAYYMENINGRQYVVSEFQRPLADVYGLSSWYHDQTKEVKRVKYWEEVFALISQFDLETQYNGATIIQVSSLVSEKLVQYFLANPSYLQTMNHRDFEELIAEVFDGFGYQVELTKRTRDGGRDIVAIAGRNQLVSSKYLVECKRYKASNKIGIQPVRSLFGVLHDEGATKAILATTSSFTKDANDFIERNKWVLEGRDFEGILQWLEKYQQLKFPEA